MACGLICGFPFSSKYLNQENENMYSKILVDLKVKTVYNCLKIVWNSWQDIVGFWAK